MDQEYFTSPLHGIFIEPKVTSKYLVESLFLNFSCLSKLLIFLIYGILFRYYSMQYLHGAPNRIPPHQDSEISKERKECLKKYFANEDERRSVNEEFASFSACLEEFSSSDSINDRGKMKPMKWWVVHGSSTPNLQKLALKLLGQPCSSSCCERNWSTYKFIHSLRRNKIAPQRAEDLVYVHNNFRLLSRRTPQYKGRKM